MPCAEAGERCSTLTALLQVEVTVLPPQGEPRKRSVGRRFSSFVTLFRRVGAAAISLGGCLRPLLPATCAGAYLSVHYLLPILDATVPPCCPGGWCGVGACTAWGTAPSNTAWRTQPIPRLQLREELGPTVMRGLDPPPRRSLQGVNRK